MVSRAKILNRSRFAIIVNKDTDIRRLIRRKRIANAGNGFDEFVPAELLAQVGALAQGKIAQRTTRRKRHPAGKEVSTAENQASKEDGFDSVISKILSIRDFIIMSRPTMFATAT